MRTEFRFLSDSAPAKELPPTMVFIDYESLYVSFNYIYNSKPDLKILVEDFRKVGRIMAIKVFGDFTKPELSLERNRVRTITNFLIDCGNESTVSKKDFTDFIMLDHIYQDTIQNTSIKQFIFVTGDGHFSSAATFLRMYMDKVVGIYGIQKTLSRQLRECSSWVRAIEVYDDDEEEYMRKIAHSLRRAEDSGKFATFRKTCDIVSTNYRMDYETCKRVLHQMINNGFIDSELVTSLGDREFQRLVANWDLLNAYLE